MSTPTFTLSFLSLALLPIIQVNSETVYFPEKELTREKVDYLMIDDSNNKLNKHQRFGQSYSANQQKNKRLFVKRK